MNQKTKLESGLRRLEYDFIETDSSSIFTADLPKEFGIGKNRFKLSATSKTLLKGSDVFIDVIDSNGQPIYFEVSNLTNDDNTRNVVVYIYDTTPQGDCQVLVGGTTKNVSQEKLGTVNYLFKTKVPVKTSNATAAELVFKKNPTVSFTERLQPVATSIGDNRYTVRVRVSGSISTQTTNVQPRQLSDSKLNIERRIETKNNVVFVGSGSRNEISQTDIEIPSYTDFSIIRSETFEFSSSMKDGRIEVNDIRPNYPKDARVDGEYVSLSYSASIIEVVDQNTIKVYPPYYKKIPYFNDAGDQLFLADRFFNQTNFTCSYYEYVNLSLTQTTQSFVQMDISGLEPEFGYLNGIQVSYKPVSSFGDFKPIGKFDNKPVNLLVDESSVAADNANGLIPKSIGQFRRENLGDLPNEGQKYWQMVGGDRTTTNVGLKESILVSGSSDFYLQPKPQYSASIVRETEYVLGFKYLNNDNAVMSVYVSGTGEFSQVGNAGKISAIDTRHTNLGTFVGSITEKNNKLGDGKFNFKAVETGTIYPIFQFSTGSWNLSDITIHPVHETGFSGNQVKFQIPLDDVEKNTELLLKVQYLNSSDEPSKKESLLSGVVFKGKTPEPTYPSQSYAKNDTSWTAELTQFSSASFNSSGRSLTVDFPAFTTANGNYHTGSSYNVGMGFTVETVVFGRTGSAQSPTDTYVWAGTAQGRALTSRLDTSGQPLLFRYVAHSGSSVNQIGTFGSGPVNGVVDGFKTNLDSWFRLTSMESLGTGLLRVTYELTSTSSFYWDAYASSHLRAVYYEQNYQ